MPDIPDLVIEYSINGGVTWHHGKTVPGRVRHDKHALLAQRAAVREQAHIGHGDEVIITRVLPEGDPRAVVNRLILEPGGTITVTRGQLLSVLSDAGLITPGAGTGSDVWDTLARRAGAQRWAAAVPRQPAAPPDDELSRQQAAEALAEWQAAMADEGALGDMLAAGQQMAEFIAGWLDAAGMPEGVDNPD